MWMRITNVFSNDDYACWFPVCLHMECEDVGGIICVCIYVDPLGFHNKVSNEGKKTSFHTKTEPQSSNSQLILRITKVHVLGLLSQQTHSYLNFSSSVCVCMCLSSLPCVDKLWTNVFQYHSCSCASKSMLEVKTMF